MCPSSSGQRFGKRREKEDGRGGQEDVSWF